MDRITKDTLGTYNTWIRFSLLQKIYRSHCMKLSFCGEVSPPLLLLSTRLLHGKRFRLLGITVALNLLQAV